MPRAGYGRPKVVTQPGPRVCLMCRRPFKSKHVINERVCKDCKSTDAWKSPYMQEAPGRSTGKGHE